MIYYLICFSSSLFLLWFGQKIRYGQCEIFRWLVYGIALLIPIAFAGLRDWSIGTDVLYYCYGVFTEARVIPNTEGFSNRWALWIEPGFLWLGFGVAQITHDFNAFLFVLMFLQMIFIFFAIYQWRDKFPIWLGMLVFYAFFFNESLNTMRQCLALSIVSFGIKDIFKRNFLRFMLFILLGSLFHKSVIIWLAFYPMFWYSNKFTSKKTTLLFSIILFSSIIFSNQIIIPFLNAISGIIPIAEIIVNYLNYAETGRVPYKVFIFYCFLAFLFLYKRKVILAYFPNSWHFFEIMTMLVVIIQLLPLVGGTFVYRFVMLATWWLFILIPIIFYSYNKIFPKTIINLAIAFYCLFYYYIVYFHFTTGDTDRYSSSILSSIF